MYVRQAIDQHERDPLHCALSAFSIGTCRAFRCHKRTQRALTVKLSGRLIIVGQASLRQDTAIENDERRTCAACDTACERRACSYKANIKPCSWTRLAISVNETVSSSSGSTLDHCANLYTLCRPHSLPLLSAITGSHRYSDKERISSVNDVLQLNNEC